MTTAHAEESAAGHGIIGRIRIISSTLEQTLEAATAGITAALEAATMGYTPPAPVRGASRSRRRERIHNQKRNVKWVDLEAPCGTTGFAATVCEGDANPRTMQVWKRSRSHESYEDMGGQGETTDQQHIVFRALVSARSAPRRTRACARSGMTRRGVSPWHHPFAPRAFARGIAIARRRTKSARRRRALSRERCTTARQPQPMAMMTRRTALRPTLARSMLRSQGWEAMTRAPELSVETAEPRPPRPLICQ
jgi:hypothetical protein